MTINRLIAFIFVLITVAGCKIIQTVPEGGYISSRTGTNDCTAYETCEIDVVNGEAFSDTFTAEPDAGYQFVAWKEQDRFLCGGSSTSCALENVPGSFTDQDIDLFLEPVFEKIVDGAEIFGIWELPNENVVFMYFPDGRYFAIQWEEENNFIGFERGTYDVEGSNLSFTTLQNHDGEALVCNEPKETTCSNEAFIYSVERNELSLSEDNDDPSLSFQKIPPHGYPLYGLWELSGENVFFMFLPDGRYFGVQWVEENGFVGFERGIYSSDDVTFTVTTLQNNDGEALFCNEPEGATCPDKTFGYSITGGELELTVPDPDEPDQEPISFTRIL